jgi:SnoaL-like protein
MTSTSLQDLYRRWLDELWAGQPSAAEQLVGDSFVGHWPNPDVHGPNELAAIIAETRDIFTEITFEPEVGPIVDGDLVAARWIGRGVTDEGTSLASAIAVVSTPAVVWIPVVIAGTLLTERGYRPARLDPAWA